MCGASRRRGFGCCRAVEGNAKATSLEMAGESDDVPSPKRISLRTHQPAGSDPDVPISGAVDHKAIVLSFDVFHLSIVQRQYQQA